MVPVRCLEPTKKQPPACRGLCEWFWLLGANSVAVAFGNGDFVRQQFCFEDQNRGTELRVFTFGEDAGGDEWFAVLVIASSFADDVHVLAILDQVGNLRGGHLHRDVRFDAPNLSAWFAVNDAAGR